MGTTTDLDIIRHSPKRFTWGRVLNIYDVGPYSIVEHEPNTSGTPLKPEVSFHVYVNGQDTSRGASTLEGAMIIAVACRQIDNRNVQDHMARAAAKLLDVPW